VLAVEVPKPVGLEHEVEAKLRVEAWLEDRRVGIAGDVYRRLRTSVGIELRGPQSGGVPGHVRMTPLQPNEAVGAGVDAGRCVEVRATHENLHAARVEVDGHERVLGLLDAGRVPLADGDDAVPARVHQQFRQAPAVGGRRGQRADGATGPAVVKALVRVVNEVDVPAMGDIGAAAVLVHPAADVEGGGRHLLSASVGSECDQGRAPALVGAALGPVRGAVLAQRAASEAQGLARDGRSADGRWPRAAGQRSRSLHLI
jgi:hypothetical protein